MKKRNSLWRTLSMVFSILLAIIIGLSVVGYLYNDDVNELLGTDTIVVRNSSDDTPTTYYESDYNNIADLYNNKIALIQEIVSEGSVLLKNNGALPLSSNSYISIFGKNSTDWAYGITGGASTIDTTRCDDLKTVLESRGFSVNPTLWSAYLSSDASARATGSSITIGEAPASVYTSNVRSSYNQYSDAALVVFSRSTGEGNDFPTDASLINDGDGVHIALELQENELAALEEAKSASDTVIVIINSDHAMEIDDLKNDADVDAIIQVGGTGVQGLYGFAEVLDGTVSPSGHLSDTYAVNSLSSPAIQNFGDYTYTNTGDLYGTTTSLASHYVVYQESIYVGYKYYETRYEDYVLGQGQAESSKGSSTGDEWNYTDEVSYSFGYGLSYTTFSQTVDSFEITEDGTIRMTVTVVNTGDYPGKDVVQLYGQSPYTDYDVTNKIEKSAVQLIGFEKTGTLAANGGTQTVTVEADMYYMASYDYINAKTYILDEGNYYFAIGNGAHDALNNILAAKGCSVSDGMDEDGDASKVRVYNNPSLDTTTYSESYSGATVENQLDDADINYFYDNDVVRYLTRSDWTSFPESLTTLTASQKLVDALVDGVTYDPDSEEYADIEQPIYGSTETNYSITLMIGEDFDNPYWEYILNQMTLDEISTLIGRGRVQLYAATSIGFPGAQQKDGPAGISVTYNTSDSQYQVSPVMYQSEVTLAQTFNKELAAAQGCMFGNDSLWTDVEFVWAPGVNIHRTPYSGRNSEYFSEDSMLTYYMALNEVKAAREYGLIMSPKHFAFNDQETNRGGVATFMTEQTAREIDLRPFEGCFTIGGALNSMAAYNRIGATYVGAHVGLMTGILQEEWGYVGGVISDSVGALDHVSFQNGPASIVAGLTTFCCSSRGYYYEGTLGSDVLAEDPVLLSAAREAVHRVLYACVNSSAMNGLTSSSELVSVVPWWVTMLIVGISVSAVGMVAFGTVHVIMVYKIKRSKEDE